jgi:uronate dehydrogenase
VTVLITGASGFIGTGLRREFAQRAHRLRLFDRQPVEHLAENEECVVGDIGDLEGLARAMDGVSGVIHLAGCTSESDINVQIEGNVRGAWNVFESARRRGVERVVFASSNHVVGYYPRQRRVGTDVLLRPDSRYGLTKAFGEQAGALFADKYGLRVLCIRVGNANDQPLDRRRLSIWSSWRDLAQLVDIGLTHPTLRYAVVYGVSNNDRSFYDNETAFRLGYRPQDNAEFYADQVIATTSVEEAGRPGTLAMGGDFANEGFLGDVDRLMEW